MSENEYIIDSLDLAFRQSKFVLNVLNQTKDFNKMQDLLRELRNSAFEISINSKALLHNLGD